MTHEEQLRGNITETAERIVIDYANCSGREDLNRSQFRGMVIGHLVDFYQSELESICKEIEELRKEFTVSNFDRKYDEILQILTKRI